ncbi:MAG: hypothetical protein ACI8XB_000254 [Patiriisocius sp.]|jgi:hypothetical protein
MKKDLIPNDVKDIIVAVVKELSTDKEMVWNVYLINKKPVQIEGVLVSSNGYGIKKATPEAKLDGAEDEKINTSMLRHFLDEVEANSFKKIEMITEEVFGIFNQYWVSFYEDKKMSDKKFIFPAESISEVNFTMIPVINLKGVMIE